LQKNSGRTGQLAACRKLYRDPLRSFTHGHYPECCEKWMNSNFDAEK
jgi:hypothetical protein